MLALENSEEASAAEQCEDRRKEHLGSEGQITWGLWAIAYFGILF